MKRDVTGEGQQQLDRHQSHFDHGLKEYNGKAAVHQLAVDAAWTATYAEYERQKSHEHDVRLQMATKLWQQQRAHGVSHREAPLEPRGGMEPRGGV